MNSEYYMCETEEGILQLSMLILLYKTELPADLYCIGSPLVAVSFKVLNWRYWRLQRRSGAPVEPGEALIHAAGSGFDANKVL
jgi:hypothetical protein